MTACPKCDRDVPDGAAACPGCGLAASRFETFADSEDAGAPPPEVAAAWARCLSAWDDPESHERFLRVAGAAGAFAFAGRAYRRAARERGGADPHAAAGAERVRRLAEAAYLSRPAPGAQAAEGDRDRFRKGAMLVLAVVLLLALGGMVLYMTKVRSQGGAGTQNSRVGVLIESVR